MRKDTAHVTMSEFKIGGVGFPIIVSSRGGSDPIQSNTAYKLREPYWPESILAEVRVMLNGYLEALAMLPELVEWPGEPFIGKHPYSDEFIQGTMQCVWGQPDSKEVVASLRLWTEKEMVQGPEVLRFSVETTEGLQRLLELRGKPQKLKFYPWGDRFDLFWDIDSFSAGVLPAVLLELTGASLTLVEQRSNTEASFSFEAEGFPSLVFKCQISSQKLEGASSLEKVSSDWAKQVKDLSQPPPPKAVACFQPERLWFTSVIYF